MVEIFSNFHKKDYLYRIIKLQEIVINTCNKIIV